MDRLFAKGFDTYKIFFYNKAATGADSRGRGAKAPF